VLEIGQENSSSGDVSETDIPVANNFGLFSSVDIYMYMLLGVFYFIFSPRWGERANSQKMKTVFGDGETRQEFGHIESR